MHESLADEDYSKIIYELKDEHKELLYFLYIRDYSTQKLAAMRNQSDRNIRGVRSTVLGQIEKIAREQAKLETKQDKNNTNDKKAV